ncbi:MAG: hypothetical protein QMD76_03200 [Anaerosomatales bacterium]|nr:hypothetical protein [Coriobacteriia bacterium]MDI6692301.1 hypothetical protein [Anaerosomatales bacterium]GAV32255.1 hypothetical protein emb_1d0849 [Coriobacteriaceae bacterium EMTCatB1]
MGFLWSDAWILSAIACAQANGGSTLAEVLLFADGLNHTLPLDGELHGALSRLTEAGYVSEDAGEFRVTDRVPVDVRDPADAAEFLRSEPWTQEVNVRDSRNDRVYPGLTDERIRAAYVQYERAWRALMRGQRDTS